MPRERRSPRVPGPTAPVYVISVAAELTGLHPQTLRQYDRVGLVSPGRTGGGGRRYSLRDIELLREVARHRRALRFVLRKALLAVRGRGGVEHHRAALGHAPGEELAEHRREPEDRVGRQAAPGREVRRDREEGPEHEPRSVHQHQPLDLCHGRQDRRGAAALASAAHTVRVSSA